MESIQLLCIELDVTIAQDKISRPSHTLTYLGVEIYSRHKISQNGKAWQNVTPQVNLSVYHSLIQSSYYIETWWIFYRAEIVFDLY